MGKNKADDKSIMDFNNFQMRAGLSDTAFDGGKFTWDNKRKR